MTEANFIPKSYKNQLEKGKVSWQSPSNIALIKYWGKYGEQLPANPSISFTLNNCKTTTEVTYQLKEKPSNNFDFDVYFEGDISHDFKPKIETFFKRVEKYLPFLKDYKFKIHTSNTFPHSSGIASSASGMSALALCLVDMERSLSEVEIIDSYFIQKASFIA